MIGLDYDRDSESCCPGCGVYMEVIGPPGPRHSYDCPETQREREQAARNAAREEAFWQKYPVTRWPCGCVASAQGVESPCFKPNCRLLSKWRNFPGGTYGF